LLNSALLVGGGSINTFHQTNIEDDKSIPLKKLETMKKILKKFKKVQTQVASSHII